MPADDRHVMIELTPLGKALMRLARAVGANAEECPDDVREAALDVLAIAEERIA